MSGQNITRRSKDQLQSGLTDLERLKNLTDAEIDAGIARDTDAAAADMDWTEAGIVYPPKKTPVSIRIDEDVLAFFRSSGRGYQTRINAVLRQFMAHQKDRKAS
ncbi:MAG: hypothetical protein C0605_17565 [Hyphomicrobiales bacterium]|nr:MAG: hypothetical protein C0605_17565 [Hyphomicrobiales bacterium]